MASKANLFQSVNLDVLSMLCKLTCLDLFVADIVELILCLGSVHNKFQLGLI